MECECTFWTRTPAPLQQSIPLMHTDAVFVQPLMYTICVQFDNSVFVHFCRGIDTEHPSFLGEAEWVRNLHIYIPFLATYNGL